MRILKGEAVEDLESILGTTGKAAVVLIEWRVNYRVIGVIGSAATRCHLALWPIGRSHYSCIIPLECFLQLLMAIPVLVVSSAL